MITAVRNDNSVLYKDLFAKASEILSGFERTQTFDANKNYFYKDSATNEFVQYVFTATTDDGKIYEFANALTEYGYLYIETEKGPVKGFIPELGITTLEEYYNWLPEIKRDNEGNPTIFTKLPLDEPYLEINANTRAITIPAEFKKNGIAVQGDDLAEVVYFKIDRYFDAMDFNNTEIFIEWETPKGKNGSVVKSVSDIYLKDIESEPGKLIFGWAISDAITKDSGTLKFSVRFIQWVDNSETGKKEIVYSFNTLTAQATISPNLGLDLENDTYEIDNANDRLLERIEPGEVVGGAQAKVPYYLTDITILADGYDIEPNHTDGTYTLQVVATADDTGAVSYVWKRADLNTHNVSDNAWIEIPDSNQVDMFELTDKELEDCKYILPSNHTYYISNDEGASYQPLPRNEYDLKQRADYIQNNIIPTIYEQRAYLVVEKWGQYRAEARNRIFNSLTKKNSEVATFKRPEAVEFNNTNETVEKHILGGDSAVLAPQVIDAVGDLDYQWYKTSEEEKEFLKVNTVLNLPQGALVSYSADTVRIAFADETRWVENNIDYPGHYMYNIYSYAPSGAVKYTWTAVRGAHKTDLVANTQKWDVDPVGNAGHVGSDGRGSYVVTDLYAASLINNVWVDISDYQSDLEFGTKGNTIMIEWYDDSNNKIKVDTFNVEYYKADNFEPLVVAEEIVNTNDNPAVLVATEPGFYQLKVIRTRNRATTENHSINYRVTAEPAIPEAAEGVYDGQKLVFVTDLLAGEDLEVKWTVDGDADEFYVVWKLYRGQKDMEDLVINTQKLVGNVYTSKFNPTSILYSDIFADANEDVEGLYYAVFATKLNGVMSNYSAAPDPLYMFTVTGS